MFCHLHWWDTAHLALTHFLVATHCHSHVDGCLADFFIMELLESCPLEMKITRIIDFFFFRAMSKAKRSPVGSTGTDSKDKKRRKDGKSQLFKR